MPITWRGKEVTAAIAAKAVAGLSEIDLRIETEAKKQLYPGHGKRTGFLQRSIAGEDATQDGTWVRGKVSVRGVTYALVIERRYGYMQEAVRIVKPQALAILRKHMT